jgi:hypothetical protein
VLDDVRDVNAGAVDPRRRQRAIEQLARRPDEWPAREILTVTWRLADQHDRRVIRAFAEYRLSRATKQVAAAATGGGVPRGG